MTEWVNRLLKWKIFCYMCGKQVELVKVNLNGSQDKVLFRCFDCGHDYEVALKPEGN